MIPALLLVAVALTVAVVTICHAHARRAARDEREAAEYRSFSDLGDPLKRRGGPA